MASDPIPSAPIPARERILRTAQDLFYRQGIRATGIDRIIAEAGVTKVTFYRHFPSKDDLIRAYLERRHAAWMGWFREALSSSCATQSEAERLKAPLGPVLDAARTWFGLVEFRGCAFANTVAEVGGIDLPITSIAAQHKHEVRDAIAALLPSSARDNTDIAWAATLALDGAAVNAQLGQASADVALDGLRILLDALGSRLPLP
ncbi:TetR/AcrR family transcriptional regulator [Methylobacterium sp. NPDC080182]|uniref:TetR/AcrR family transcriptional regulator n=1 Tax=Methylobacterium sp. NPDC080182 TaxID=3390590 RepID=UPI003D045A56